MTEDIDIALPLHAYCDGSGTHHDDSPACIGVVVADDEGRILCEASQFVRIGSNNVAEILAIRRALFLIAQLGPLAHQTPAIVYSDSQYAIGFVTGAWGNRSGYANHELSAPMLRQYAMHRGAARIEHVRGHAGVVGNELADWLAWRARRDHLVARGAVGPLQTRRRRPSADAALVEPVRVKAEPKKKSRRSRRSVQEAT